MISSTQLGARITQARQRQDKTQEELATALGVAWTTLVAMEQGERLPSNTEMLKLAQVLSVTVNELLSEQTVVAEAAPLLRIADERMAFEAYAQELLSEGELARYLDCDRVTARDRYLAWQVEDADAEPAR